MKELNFLSKLKKERIDKEYYVTEDFDEEACIDLLKKAEDFQVEIEIFINKLIKDNIDKYRREFNKI
jgi:hypothetical protein